MPAPPLAHSSVSEKFPLMVVACVLVTTLVRMRLIVRRFVYSPLPLFIAQGSERFTGCARREEGPSGGFGSSRKTGSGYRGMGRRNGCVEREPLLFGVRFVGVRFIGVRPHTANWVSCALCLLLFQ